MEIARALTLAKRLWLRLSLTVAAAFIGTLGITHAAHAGSLHHAALLIQHSGGGLLTRCVSFVEDQVSGFQLIQRSGVEYQAQPFGSMGSAICQLDGEPSPVPSNCFGSGAYWQYFHRTTSGWRPSQVGASSWTLHDGDMDGWRYAAGPGQPAGLTFGAICGQPSTVTTPAAIHTAVATLSASPSPSPLLPALAPSPSVTAKSALATTGPAHNGPPTSTGTWLLLGIGSIFLVGIGAVNLVRRGP